ncbi:MAG TPA: SDR family oxidoreductase [Stellaceae bacterium]|nr:SDR family oxidoreductase [Stellaceae bacterium]
MPPAPHLFCIGLGYVALTLAERIAAEGWRVSGTCRAPAKAASLVARGIAAHATDGSTPDIAGMLGSVTHVLSSVPPDEHGDPALALFSDALARRPDLAWVGYLSTTGVYGDRSGGWVDETMALAPRSERGRRRVVAETAWLALRYEAGLPVHVFRLGGIYGPGRSALDTVRAGTAQRVIKPGQVFSRIHVADIASVLQASMARPNPGAAYNLADDEPTSPDEVLSYAARLLGLPPPPAVLFETANLSEMARGFYADNKRVANGRIKRELGVCLAYPTYREGLAALLAESPEA